MISRTQQPEGQLRKLGDEGRAAARRQDNDNNNVVRKRGRVQRFLPEIGNDDRSRDGNAWGRSLELADAECGADRTGFILVRADVQMARRNRDQDGESNCGDRRRDPLQAGSPRLSAQYRHGG